MRDTFGRLEQQQTPGGIFQRHTPPLGRTGDAQVVPRIIIAPQGETKAPLTGRRPMTGSAGAAVARQDGLDLVAEGGGSLLGVSAGSADQQEDG